MTAAGNMVHCQLWMGGLEPYMTESFILASFQRMGEKPLSVKVMRNKFSGEPAGYCFVHFENDDEAIDAMHKLNGKIIPNTNPAVRFRLNTATNQGKIMMNDREFSLWVGDLSAEVDDYTLYKTFAAKYQSLKAAKVILDVSGYSKGFGFLRFGIEEEQKNCLTHMNGYKGLGTKPLKISNAIPKTQRAPTANGQPNNQGSSGYQYPADYSQYYDPNYWQNYGQWSGYGYDPSTGNYSYDPSSYSQYSNQYPGQYPTQYPAPSSQYPSQQNYTAYSHGSYSSYYPPQPSSTTSTLAPAAGTGTAAGSQSSVIPVTIASSGSAPVDDANSVVEHSLPVDVEKENREYGEAIVSFWVDLALYSGLNQEVFEDEVAKLNIVDIPMPQIPAKLENRAQARSAIEAQDIYDLSTYALSESSSSEGEDSFSKEGSSEPAEKKRKLSDTTTNILEGVAAALKEETTSENRVSIEDVEMKEEVEGEVKKEDEECANKEDNAAIVKVERDEDNVSTKVEVEKDEAAVVVENDYVTDDVTMAEPAMISQEETSVVDGVPQKIEEKASEVKAKEDWKKMEGFMATVDLDVLMTETESVSSESTHNSDIGSDSDESSDCEGNDPNDDAVINQTAENGESEQSKNELSPPNVPPPKCDEDESTAESANDDTTKLENKVDKLDSSAKPCDSISNLDLTNEINDCEVVNGSMETEDD